MQSHPFQKKSKQPLCKNQNGQIFVELLVFFLIFVVLISTAFSKINLIKEQRNGTQFNYRKNR